MKKINIWTLALVTAMATPTAFAQYAKQSLYGELGVTSLTHKSSDGLQTLKPTVLRGIFGYNLTPHFAGEILVGVGVSEANTDFTSRVGSPPTTTSFTTNEKVSSLTGMYAKLRADVTPEFEVFGRVGYTNMNATVKASVTSGVDSGYSASKDGKVSGASWGLGAKYAVTQKFALTVDAMHYANDDGITLTGSTLGLAYKF